VTKDAGSFLGLPPKDARWSSIDCLSSFNLGACAALLEFGPLKNAIVCALVKQTQEVLGCGCQHYPEAIFVTMSTALVNRVLTMI